MREKFRGGQLAEKWRVLVEIFVVKCGKNLMQYGLRLADIDDDVVGIEDWPEKCCLYGECGAVQALRRPEDRSLQAVSNHEMIRNGQAIHDDFAQFPG